MLGANICLALALASSAQISYGPQRPIIETGAASHLWCWENQAGTELNHIYMAQWQQPWTRLATIAAGPGEACHYLSNALMPYGLVFLEVRAANEAGESAPQHGEGPGL